MTAANSRALNATRALNPVDATGNAGFDSGDPSSPASIVVTSRFFSARQRSTAKPPGQQSSQRGLSSAPDSHGWHSSTRPEPSRSRRSSRNRSPAAAAATTPSGGGVPARTSSATACPNMGGCVIDEASSRPHRPAWWPGERT